MTGLGFPGGALPLRMSAAVIAERLRLGRCLDCGGQRVAERCPSCELWPDAAPDDVDLFSSPPDTEPAPPHSEVP